MVCELDRNNTAKLGVVPLCHSQRLRPTIVPSELRRPEMRSPSFLAIPRHTRSDRSVQRRVVWKSALQAPVLLRTFALSSLEWHVAFRRSCVHVVLHAAEHELGVP